MKRVNELRPQVMNQSDAQNVDELGAFKDAKEKWVATFEQDYILNLLRKNNFNISHAAREADIDRKYFRKLMKKYGIDINAVKGTT
jgi:DNA-binding NtrC family response regulator